MGRLWCIVAALAVLALPTAAAAAPPPNDAQATATPLASFPASVDGTTLDATPASTDPQCGVPTSGSVWYALTRPDDLTVVVSFQAAGELDAVVGAFQVVRGGLKTLVCVLSDARGKAGFSFKGEKGSAYMVFVAQRANSVPGSFHLGVQAPPRPPNDDRAGATPIGKLPAAPRGTTLGGSIDPQTEHCGNLGADVWYRFDRSVTGPVVVALRAGGDLDGTLAVYRQVRSQLVPLACKQTDDKGRADASVDTTKGGRYLIAVGQLLRSAPGDFTLSVFAPEPAAVAPGPALVHGRASGTVDALTDRDDAYAVRLAAGTTYRFNLVGRSGCVGMALYPPGTQRFADASPVLEAYCGGYRTFTPGPDGGGLYSVRVTPSGATRGAQGYVLHAAAAGPDDVGPGLALASGTSVHGSLDGAGVDVVDLYRFDVLQRSDVDLRVQVGRGSIAAGVISETGDAIGSRHIRDKLRVRLGPGRYFVTLRAEDRRHARYTLGLLIREITRTGVAVDGAPKLELPQARPVTLTATVTPASASGGVVRVLVDYLDPLQGWVFSKRFVLHVAGTQAETSFLPPKIGRYRVHASFFGNRAASPSKSGMAQLLVGGPAV